MSREAMALRFGQAMAALEGAVDMIEIVQRSWEGRGCCSAVLDPTAQALTTQSLPHYYLTSRPRTTYKTRP